MEARRLGAFAFFVVITDATGVGLFAFLAELSSHFSTSSNFVDRAAHRIDRSHRFVVVASGYA